MERRANQEYHELYKLTLGASDQTHVPVTFARLAGRYRWAAAIVFLWPACSIHLSPGIGGSQRNVALFLSEYGDWQGGHFLRTGTFDASIWRFPLMRSATLSDLARAVKRDGYLCRSVTRPYAFSVTCSPQGEARGLSYFLDDTGIIRASASEPVDHESGVLTLNDDERENLRALRLSYNARRSGSRTGGITQ